MESNTKSLKFKAYRLPVVVAVAMAIIYFLPAGSFKFWEAWVNLVGIFIIGMVYTTYFLKKDPELLARRMQTKNQENTRKSPAVFKLAYLGYLIPGLDYRFHWSAVPVAVIIAANVIVFLGFIFIIFVFKENSYAASVIKVEEKQPVISTGPYSIVRHPMYTGSLFWGVFTPVALGSYWAFIPTLLIIPFLVFRIRSEEEVLLRDLPGYQDYCLKTRYRLIPAIW